MSVERKQAVGLMFVGLLFMAGAAAIGYPFFLKPICNVIAARDWPATSCHIIASAVGAHDNQDSDSHGTTYSIDIEFSYTVAGKLLRSSAYDFMGGSSTGYDGKLAIVEKYPVGGAATCYYNPARPEQAVLMRGVVPVMWFGLIPLVGFGVGCIGFFGGLIHCCRRRDDGAASRFIPMTQDNIRPDTARQDTARSTAKATTRPRARGK